MKKAQLGDSVKASIASFKNRIGDTAAVKRKADSVGVSTNKAKEALKARIAAKKAQSGKKVDSVDYYKNKMRDFDKESQRMSDSSSKYTDKLTNYIERMTPAERKSKGVSYSKQVNKSGTQTKTYKYKSGGKLTSKKKK